MNVRLLSRGVSKYRIESGYDIDAFVLGGKNKWGGYEAVLPVKVRDGQNLNCVSVKKNRRGNISMSQIKDVETEWYGAQFNCYSQGLDMDMTGYGTIYVRRQDIGNVIVIANGHRMYNDKKQNDAFIAVRKGVKILIRYVNGSFSDSKTVEVGSRAGNTVFTCCKSRDSWNTVLTHYVDVLGKETVENLRFSA